MYLVDEEDNLAVGLVDFTDDALQSLLELALVLSTGDQGTHVEAVDGLRLQVLGHVAADDTLRQSFSNSGLTHTGLADEDGVVLGTTRKDLQHTAYLLVTSDDGVEFAGLRQLVEVFGVLAKGVHGLFLVGAGHFAALAQVGNGGKECFLTNSGILKQLRNTVTATDEAEQQVLHTDELVVHLGGALLGSHKGLIGIAAEVDLTAADAWHRI